MERKELSERERERESERERERERERESGLYAERQSRRFHGSWIL